jgi:hypothetical protein
VSLEVLARGCLEYQTTICSTSLCTLKYIVEDHDGIQFVTVDFFLIEITLLRRGNPIGLNIWDLMEGVVFAFH